MNLDAVIITSEPIPEGWVLIKGTHLTCTIRSIGKPFRVARTHNPKNPCHPLSAGILVRKEDEAAMREAMDKKERRKAREAEHANPATRH